MSWVEWLKEVAERLPGASADSSRDKPAVRVAHRSGDAYAREWVKVLEDVEPGADPNSTYTWELHADAPSGAAEAAPAQPPSSGTTPRRRARDEFDTYTWELQEEELPDDPWGLGDAASTAKTTRRVVGGDPYDTGGFSDSWRGRFDRR